MMLPENVLDRVSIYYAASIHYLPLAIRFLNCLAIFVHCC